MSAELTKARSLVNTVASNLKRKNLLTAVNNLYDAVNIILRNPLIKSEREEFGDLLEQAAFQVGSDPQIKGKYPVLDEYRQGQEKDLLAALREVLNDLSSDRTDQLKDLMAERENRKTEMIAKAQNHLDRGDHSLANATFERVVAEFPSDSSLYGDIADRLLKAECYPEALKFLQEALEKDPMAIPLYNRIAMVLRKLKDYQNAEGYFLQALEHCDDDAILFFNLGRVYVDWKKWDKVEDVAAKALAIDPSFEEAKKMLAFAQKKQA